MFRLQPAPTSRTVEPAERSYVGDRRPGPALNVRLPSGAHTARGADGMAGLRLAEGVLADRLGHPPCAHLLEAFVADWVRPVRSEFFWPAEAVDDRLAGGAPDHRCDAPLDRAPALPRRVLRAPLAHHPIVPVVPGAR